jgi:pimeloyl-ACP methyl ester carboxylesterase
LICFLLQEDTMPLVPVGDVSLNVLDQGRGSPVLLVHGFPLDHTMWQGQIGPLAEKFRVIAPDLRGFGQSSVTAGVATMQQMADDLAGLLDALGIKAPVALCGLSMGGYVAWQFALRHRQKLSRLIVCDTRSLADSTEAAAGRRKTAERVMAEGAKVVAEAMLPKLFAKSTAEEQPATVEQTKQVILRTSPAGIAAALLGMAERPDVSDRLSELDLPALVLCGQHDAISPPTEMRGIAERLPQAKFVAIAGAGHMAPLEQPAVVNKELLDFLGR